ncbi:MAG: SDR family oxidoreductase [Anaerolineales bacterium]|nr:SDR family oxidoreductase [Anaerolineales bacterium]
MTIALVTGGAGFIGSHLATALLERGYEVRVIDNFSTGKRENIAPILDKITLYEASITDIDALRIAMENVEYVFHQAAIPSVPRSVTDPETSHEINVNGTFRLLLAARDAGVKRVVYAASSSAYGDIVGEYKHEALAPRPLSPYGAAKLMGEYYMQVFYTTYGLETVSLRYFNVFGPRQDPTSEYSAVIPKFITAIQQGKRPVIYGDGLQSRDFTYIDNVVHGNMLAATTPDPVGQVMNVACGEQYSLLDLIDILNRYMGTDAEPEFAPPRKGDIKHSRADISKAGALMGYEPLVDFEDGLARTIEWFTKQS